MSVKVEIETVTKEAIAITFYGSSWYLVRPEQTVYLTPAEVDALKEELCQKL